MPSKRRRPGRDVARRDASTKMIAVIGSTGSVGRQALEVIAAEERFAVCALTARRNWQLLAEQAHRFRPEAVAIAEPDAAGPLSKALPEGVTLLSGPEAAAEIIGRTSPDMVLTAVVGSAGLAPTLAAIEAGADLAVANKESLVMAGAIIMPAARSAGVAVIPVDSEHSAIFQCIRGQHGDAKSPSPGSGQLRRDVRRAIITASGGPFRDWPAERIERASREEALNHPTWRMGPKVTIDSATLMNKALEVVEAHWLFDLGADEIEVLIHPESLVHALVEFRDGSVLAQMGRPSMITPISFALYYPERPVVSGTNGRLLTGSSDAAAPLDLAELGSLHFSRADPERHAAIELGYEAIRRGGTAGAILSAADEVAVEAFLAGRIQFGQILEIAEAVLNQTPVSAEVNLDVVLAADAEARRRAMRTVEQRQVRSRLRSGSKA